MVILLMPINGYSINAYLWLLYWCLLMVILLMLIYGYYIDVY